MPANVQHLFIFTKKLASVPQISKMTASISLKRGRFACFCKGCYIWKYFDKYLVIASNFSIFATNKILSLYI